MINNLINISHVRHNSWINTKYHFHKYLEILLILSDDECMFFVGEKRYPIKKGCLFIINSTDLHTTITEKAIAYEYVCIHFYPEFVFEFNSENTNFLDCFHNREYGYNQCIQLNDIQLEKIQYLISKTNYYLSLPKNEYAADTNAKISFMEILIFINSLFYNMDSPSNFSDSSFEKIKPVLEYIQNNLDQDLSLNTLAQNFFFNKYYLSRNFKKITGFGLNEYIIYRRIMHSQELLKHNYSVQRVSEMVGFNSINHFIRTFTKIIKMSPKQFALSNSNHDLNNKNLPFSKI